MKTMRTLGGLLAFLVVVTISPAVNASSVYLDPASSDVQLSDGTATLSLYMDFSDTLTVGGGIDLSLSGPISFNSFTPTAYFSGLDSFFTGYSTANADGDLEVHFGDFAGLGGVNKLGDLTVNLNGLGTGNIGMNINSLYGDFYDTSSNLMSVSLQGAQINVVPLPAAAWLLMSALGLLLPGRRLIGKA